jgi:signal transduction histidine kinase
LIDIVARESDRLDHTVGEFLQFSKPSEPIKEFFPLKAAAEEAIQILEQAGKLNQKTCRTTNRIANDLEIWADAEQIKRIFMNLLSNSCQAFGEKGGDIVMEAAEQKNAAAGREEIALKISDNGPGIADQVLPKIFEPFYTTRESGTGLGLAIVRQLVESHGGRIRVETTLGEKTEFIITIPLP